MRTWFAIWMVGSAIVGGFDTQLSAIEGDDRPWWGRAIFAMMVGGLFSLPFGVLAIAARMP